jgi:hypothetical protein
MVNRSSSRRGASSTCPARADQPVLVFDIGRDRLWFANPRTRSYWEGTAEEYCAATKALVDAAMGSVEERMREQLAKLPPAQRAQVEQMISDAEFAPPTGFRKAALAEVFGATATGR